MLRLVLAASVIGYTVVLCIWFLLRLAFKDNLSWLALANTGALYLFAPLVLFIPLVLLARRWRLLAVLLLPLALFLYLFGASFLPRVPRRLADRPTLRVMTFNVFGNSPQPELATTLIETENPDLLLIQELSPRHSFDLTGRLGTRYPYRAFEPLYGRRGIGVLSKFPIESLGWLRLGQDRYAAQQLLLDWQGEKIKLINVHLESTRPGENVDTSFRERETQIAQLLRVVSDDPMPTLIAGDFNMTDTTQGYATMTSRLQDAYRQSGWGLGLTFPTHPIFIRSVLASSIARLINNRSTTVYGWLEPIDIPPLPLLRIDYIFTTPDLVPTGARVADWDGQSDHRAVIAELQFQAP